MSSNSAQELLLVKYSLKPLRRYFLPGIDLSLFTLCPRRLLRILCWLSNQWTLQLLKVIVKVTAKPQELRRPRST
jgi:hypothetical protein